jgi:hypothetical protein
MMTPEEIMMASFEDELEKIAGARRLARLLKSKNYGPGHHEAARTAFEKLERRAKRFPGGGDEYLRYGTRQSDDTIEEAMNLFNRHGNPSVFLMLSRKRKGGMPPIDHFLRPASKAK